MEDMLSVYWEQLYWIKIKGGLIKIDQISSQNQSNYLRIVCMCWLHLWQYQDRLWPGGVGASVGVNSYSHDCGANSSEPIHMQHFRRHVYDSSSENSLSLACVILRCRCKFVPSQHRGEWQSCWVQMSPSQEGSLGGEAVHRGRGQQKNPKSWS